MFNKIPAMHSKIKFNFSVSKTCIGHNKKGHYTNPLLAFCRGDCLTYIDAAGTFAFKLDPVELLSAQNLTKESSD